MSSEVIPINCETLKKTLNSNKNTFGYPHKPYEIYRDFIKDARSKPHSALCDLLNLRMYQCKKLVEMTKEEDADIDKIKEKFGFLAGSILLDWFFPRLFPKWKGMFESGSRNIQKSKNLKKLGENLQWLVDTLARLKKELPKKDFTIKLIED